ncbi:PorT family protein [Bacteroidales bacterium OttesenSCG-928-J19]|nr:PorT family protein [Bacteroidales bacterium OttesenSCG-928-J19]
MKTRRFLFGSFLALLSFLCLPTGNAQDNKAFNWGIRAGLNAMTPISSFTAQMAETELENVQVKNKVGLNAAFFTRINLDQFFFQPELNWNSNQEELSFSIPEDSGIGLKASNIDIDSYSANVSMLLGYNVVSNGPYLFNVMLGTSYKYNYMTKFRFDNNVNFSTYEPDYSYQAIAVVSFSIDVFYFDVRYEYNFPNTKIEFANMEDSPENIKPLTINKNENILSFSVGMMF